MGPIPTVVPLLNRIARLALIHAGEAALKLRLGKAARTINITTLLADVVPEEANFDGYTAGGITVVYTTGIVTPDGFAVNESQLFQFIMATAVTPNTIYYYWIDDGAKIIQAGNLPAPVAMNRVGAALKLAIDDSYPPGVPSVQVLP